MLWHSLALMLKTFAISSRFQLRFLFRYDAIINHANRLRYTRYTSILYLRSIFTSMLTIQKTYLDRRFKHLLSMHIYKT